VLKSPVMLAHIEAQQELRQLVIVENVLLESTLQLEQALVQVSGIEKNFL
jgi:hypothetical protein